MPGRTRRTPRARVVRVAGAAGLAALVVATALVGVGARPAAAATTELSFLGAATAGPYTSYSSKGTTEAFSAAAVGDVWGGPEPEIVVGGMDGCVRAFNLALHTVVGCYYTGPGAVQASPTLLDLTGDGKLDILTANGVTGWVVGFRGTDGAQVFAGSTYAGVNPGVFGTPTAGDLDHDGQLEIVATSFDHFIFAWRLDGSVMPGFPRFVYDTVWSSPVLADLDGDRRLEIIFGGDMDAYPGAPYPAGGLLWAFRHDGTHQPGFPRSLPGQVIWSTPAVVDLDLDGSLDIVFGTGLNFADPNGRRVHALNRLGYSLGGWEGGVTVAGRVMASPAVGQLWGDSRPEVAVLTEGGYVTVLSAWGAHVWTSCNGTGGCADGKATHGAVSIADVDNDGAAEVVGAAEKHLRVFNGSSGAVEDTEVMEAITYAPGAPPTIVTLQGQTWVIQPSVIETGGAGRGVGDSLRVYVWRSGTALGSAAWPTFKYDMARRGTPVPPPPPPDWDFETLDPTGNTGFHPSTVLPASLPHVFYQEESAGDLRHGWWNGAAWAFETLDAAGSTGFEPSAVLASGGRPHVFYRDGSSQDLRHAWWNGVAWGFETLDATGSTGFEPSAVLTANGLPHVLYRDGSSQDLRHAWWTGAGWGFETLDGAGGPGGRVNADVGAQPATVLSSGAPHVFYRDGSSGDLRHAWWTGASWRFETLDAAGNTGLEPSVVLPGGRPHVFYRLGTSGDLRHGWWNGAAWGFETLDVSGDTGYQTAATLLGSELPHVFYRDASGGNLRHTWWSGGGWGSETLDGEGGSAGRVVSDTGFEPAVVLPAGAPHVLYRDGSAGDLRHGWWD